MLGDLSVKEFIDETAASSPAPGGGSIAAFNAAAGAALVEMVANLTIENPKYATVKDKMLAVQSEASQKKTFLVDCIDKDAAAFNAIMAAFKLPRATATEKEQRSAAIQAAYQKAALVPYTVGEAAAKLLDLAEVVIKEGNQNAVTDGAVAAMNVMTATRGAFYNVKINLMAIKDEAFVADLRKKMADIETALPAREKEILALVKL